jgi:hypothetical protein
MQQTLQQLGPQGAQVYTELFAAIKIGLVVALHDVFLLGAILSGLGVVTVLFMRELPLRKSYGPPPTADSAAQVGHDALPSLPQLRPEGQPVSAPLAVADAGAQRQVRGAADERSPARPGGGTGPWR